MARTFSPAESVDSSKEDEHEIFFYERYFVTHEDMQECLSYPRILPSVNGNIFRHHGQS